MFWPCLTDGQDAAAFFGRWRNTIGLPAIMVRPMRTVPQTSTPTSITTTHRYVSLVDDMTIVRGVDVFE